MLCSRHTQNATSIGCTIYSVVVSLASMVLPPLSTYYKKVVKVDIHWDTYRQCAVRNHEPFYAWCDDCNTEIRKKVLKSIIHTHTGRQARSNLLAIYVCEYNKHIRAQGLFDLYYKGLFCANQSLYYTWRSQVKIKHYFCCTFWSHYHVWSDVAHNFH